MDELVALSKVHIKFCTYYPHRVLLPSSCALALLKFAHRLQFLMIVWSTAICTSCQRSTYLISLSLILTGRYWPTTYAFHLHSTPFSIYLKVFKLLQGGNEFDVRFDRVIIDTAPTGHTLRLLKYPQVYCFLLLLSWWPVVRCELVLSSAVWTRLSFLHVSILAHYKSYLPDYSHRKFTYRCEELTPSTYIPSSVPWRLLWAPNSSPRQVHECYSFFEIISGG